MPVLFGHRLFGLPELFCLSQNVGKLASVRPEPKAKPVFNEALA